MIKIEKKENYINNISNLDIQNQYQYDTKNIEDFLKHKSATFNFAALKRLTLSELSFNHSIHYNRICGFTRKQIVNMIQYPEYYGSEIIRLSQYMMLKSGYYKRLIEYFVNMGIINWTVDTEIKKVDFYKVSNQTLKSNYIKFVSACNKFKIDSNITNILKRMFVEDICFGFITETDTDNSIFFIEPKYCEIKKLVNGNVYEYAVNKSLISSSYINTFPLELRELIEDSKSISQNNMILIPYEKSLCLKYNNDLSYTYPPFFNLIANILLIDDYKELSKAKTESDAYKLIYFKIPTDNGKICMGDELVTPFVEMAKQIVPDTWGVVPAPMDLQLVESKSTANDDKNKTQEAVENYYGEAGVSKSLISSASSGSELKLSMKVDSSDLYRIYRQIEVWMNLQMKLRNYIYNSYQFVYHILPTTIFDINDYIDTQLKLAQSSVVNKGLLAAANGINPAKMIGNSYMENVVLNDVFDSWKPLQSSYTQSSNSLNESGRPELDETEIAEVTNTQRENGSNKRENRI